MLNSWEQFKATNNRNAMILKDYMDIKHIVRMGRVEKKLDIYCNQKFMMDLIDLKRMINSQLFHMIYHKFHKKSQF